MTLADPSRDQESASNDANILSVSQISQAIKRSLEHNFADITIQGEISGLKIPSSGHVYLTLKDDTAAINGIIWRSQAKAIKLQLEDGQAVICTGSITTYPGRSQYQLIIKQVKLAGIGALMQQLEQRKQKLLAEGLFDQHHKQQLSVVPKRIGVITSPTGSVIRDIIHRLQARWPLPVTLMPVRVQGETAATEAIAALNQFVALQENCHPLAPDLIIIARGGGSFEDLWPFNDEALVRAVFNSPIPVISAIGHETDVTLLDLVADLRAPTPTAAAELATPNRDELNSRLSELKRQLQHALQQAIYTAEQTLDITWGRLISPKHYYLQQQQRLQQLLTKLPLQLKYSFQAKHQQLEQLKALLSPQLLTFKYQSLSARLDALQQLQTSLDYRQVLKRGFAMVQDQAQQLISTKSALTKNSSYNIKFNDGEVVMHYGSTGGSKRKALKRHNTAKPSFKPSDQMELFD